MDKFTKFFNITGYDIKAFFEKFVEFCNSDYPNIVDYFNGGVMNANSFYNLVQLANEADIIEPLFILHQDTLDDISMWDILDDFTEVQTKIFTIKNSNRWLRSSVVDRTNTIQLKKTLRTNETFEDVSRQLENANPQDDWMNITIPQYIRETDYTVEDGSPIFSINLRNVGINYIDTIVDTLVDDNILGRDISADFRFENDDFVTVVADKAIEQALKIIMEAMKGCIPEFIDYGLPNEFVGTTMNAIQYPAIFKNLMNMFQRDSRWTSVELLDIYTDKDSVFLKLKAQVVARKDYLVNVPI